MRRIAVLCLLAAMILAAAPVAARSLPPDQPVAKAFTWSAQGVEVFLARTTQGDFQLWVVNGNGLEVVYRTEKNSTHPLVIKLQPLPASHGCLKVYRFRHAFSRTTIWMALEFIKDGKPVKELGRRFFGGIEGGDLPVKPMQGRPGVRPIQTPNLDRK
ncbi:MAG: hypothetical protein K9K66_03415 [Desulfarculaceae bacterium]|nr:hypothetical protein [Desulfarculaceae bacterium]MCF8071097.1 hypothetical protein [Desulfarculaceae bacterium]MCF8100685.1 hypothetical protein [Desulfarculaceae bacterium]MCF8118169.1 hypothetical protein [Desulfarculaceae bacterium]